MRIHLRSQGLHFEFRSLLPALPVSFYFAGFHFSLSEHF